MAKETAEEAVVVMDGGASGVSGGVEAHPFAFQVSGPRNVSSPNWRDLINSSWKDANYRRTVMACFIQSVYLLELDRQENRTPSTALAPNWWLPFKYKLAHTLTDPRDHSIFAAVLEWDRAAALSDLILLKPSGAPKAVLALRGTLLKTPTIRRDLEDDLRFLAWETLKGSVRFQAALDALRTVTGKYGSSSVCVAGHSLGAGFALQVGKALAKEGVFVEAHLFNPPSVSLAMSLKTIGERAGVAWRRFRSLLPVNASGEVETQKSAGGFTPVKWTPHLYVNNSDYICCYYTDRAAGEEGGGGKGDVAPAKGGIPARLFVLSKGNQRFLEAHRLEQWWADDLELQSVISNSKLISRQLKSLYSLPVTASPSPAGKQR